jgi:uncharacterized membrane protein
MEVFMIKEKISKMFIAILSLSPVFLLILAVLEGQTMIGAFLLVVALALACLALKYDTKHKKLKMAKASEANMRAKEIRIPMWFAKSVIAILAIIFALIGFMTLETTMGLILFSCSCLVLAVISYKLAWGFILSLILLLLGNNFLYWLG